MGRLQSVDVAMRVPDPAPTRADCPVCGRHDLLHSVAFAALPVLCSELHSDAASARAARTGRFATTFCRGCSHVFNAAFEQDRIGYTQSYDSSLQYSPRFVAFADALAERLSRSYALAGKTVIDVGCGKGSFLKQLCAASGTEGVGFDKSFDASRDETVPGVRFVNDWFHDGYRDLRPDFICCRHVLEHIAEPVAFLRALRAHPGIRPETVFYFEVPNALYTLRDLGIWDLIYEHVSYFTPRSLRVAFEAAGFEAIDAGSAFGEQYLYIEAKPGSSPPSALASQVDEIESLMLEFDGAYRAKVKHWRDYLAMREPDQAVIWGAGAKGVTLVNVVPGADRISRLVDVNPHKQNNFAPGTGTPIVAPEALRGRTIQSIIVMNPLYREEIAGAAAALGLAPEIVVA